jgi:TolA-binding protein
MKAGIALKQGKIETARDIYQDVLNLHFADITADDALFKLAELYQYRFNDTTKAMELYEKLISEYPGSLYVVEARKRFREMRGDAVN